MNKGIVMELSDRHVIVMTSGGVFRKLPKDGRTCEVGEEILFAEPLAARKAPPMAKLSGLVAAVVMCIVIIATMTNMTGKAEVVAYVSMDINPSVEFAIDVTEKVLDLKGLNDDGTKLIAGIDFKGKLLEAVTNDVLHKAEAQGPLAKGEGDIVIVSSLVKNTDKISDAAIADQLKEQVTKYLKAEHPNQADRYEVAAFAAPQEIRQAAEANGLSMGKYAIYLNAKNNGTPVAIEDFKQESVHQLAKQNGGIEALVNPKQPPAKGVFKQLLEEEKSGKLDERVKQLAEQRDRDSANGGGGKKPNDKTPSKSDGRSDSKKNEPGKGDEKNGKSGKYDQNKNDNRNDDKKNSSVKPTSEKPAGGATSSEQGSYINKGRSDNRDDNKKDDGKKDDEKKSDDSKSGEKSGDKKDTPPKKNDDQSQGKRNEKKDSSNSKPGANNDNQKKDEQG